MAFSRYDEHRQRNGGKETSKYYLGLNLLFVCCICSVGANVVLFSFLNILWSVHSVMFVSDKGFIFTIYKSK